MKFDFGNILNLKDLLEMLRTGLSELDLLDNTKSFQVSNISISAGDDLKIRNELNIIPSKYILTSQEGNGLVTKSDPSSKPWTANHLYLKNNGSATVKISVVFMR